MSLTRDQWIEMWESVKNIEFRADTLHKYAIKRENIHLTVKATVILKETTKIKEQIQSVIGQME